MSRIEAIEREVERLSAQELAEFRLWFARFDTEAWDRQLEADVAAGKLDELAKKALRDHEAGHSREL